MQTWDGFSAIVSSVIPGTANAQTELAEMDVQTKSTEQQLSAEEVVRKFFECYSSGRPENFDEVVAADYVDYGHTPPGHGPDAARDDYNNAVENAGGVIRYSIDALVIDGDMVAADWTGTLPSGEEARGLSLYRTSDGLLRSTRHFVYGGASS